MTYHDPTTHTILCVINRLVMPYVRYWVMDIQHCIHTYPYSVLLSSRSEKIFSWRWGGCKVKRGCRSMRGFDNGIGVLNL